MEDWWGGNSCFYRDRGGMRMTKVLERASLNLFLGIDISKEKFNACCIGSNKEKLFCMSAPMSKEGFESRNDRFADYLLTVIVRQYVCYTFLKYPSKR